VLNFGFRDDHGNGQGFGLGIDLDYGQPSGLKNPGNAKLHDDLKSKPGFAAALSVNPQPSDPRELEKDDPIREQLSRMSFTERNNFNEATAKNDFTKTDDWADSADLLSELHKKSGKNIVADYYLRIYPKDRFKTEGKLIDVLNDWADTLKSNWDADGDFLRFRRVNYYAEREMDVPNRLLKKWAADRKATGYLPLDDLAEVAALPEPLLNQPDFVGAVLLKWKLDDWVIARDARTALQMYALLNPQQRTEIQSNQGFLLSDLNPGQADTLAKLWRMNADQFANIARQRQFMRMRNDKSYSWIPDTSKTPVFPGQEAVRASAKDEAIEKAKAYFASHPDVQMSDDEKRGAFRIQGAGEGLWNCTQSGDRTFNWTFTLSF
jgi:hypothetical protein